MGVNLLQNRRRMAMSQPHLATETGAAAIFQTIIQLPLTSCSVAFDTARTGLTIRHKGKNWFDASTNTYKDDYFLNDQGREQSSSSGSGYTTSYTPVLPGTAYTFSGTIGDNSTGWRIYYYDAGKGWIKRSAWIGPAASYTFTTPDNCYFIGFQYGKSVVDFGTFQLELGNTSTAYRSYDGDEYTVSWTDSVTGTFDAVTGILNVTGGEPLQLTPIDMAAKKGINTIWADAGTATVRYYSY